jgi:sugar phosphate permease
MFFTWLVIMSFAGCWIQQYLSHVHHYSAEKCNFIFQIYWWSFMLGALILSQFLHKSKQAIYLLPLMAFIGFLDFAIMSIPVIFDYWGVILVVIFAGISASGIFWLLLSVHRSSLINLLEQ